MLSFVGFNIQMRFGQYILKVISIINSDFFQTKKKQNKNKNKNPAEPAHLNFYSQLGINSNP